jgi:hypothetical protein
MPPFSLWDCLHGIKCDVRNIFFQIILLLTQQPGPDQPLALLRPDDLHLGLVGEVVDQLLLQVVHVGEVVHQDDLFDEMRRRAVEHRVHGPQQHRPGFVVETYYHGGRGEVLEETVGGLAPEMSSALTYRSFGARRKINFHILNRIFFTSFTPKVERWKCPEWLN